MYTVIRFSLTDCKPNVALADIVRVLKSIAADEIDEEGICESEKTVSLSVATADSEEVHFAQIDTYLHKNAAAIKELTNFGCRANLDIAIDPEDRTGRLYTSFYFDIHRLKRLCDLHIELEVTVYDKTSE